MKKITLCLFLTLVLCTGIWAAGQSSTGSSVPQASISKEFTLPIVREPYSLTIMARENQTPTAPFYSSGQLPVWNEIERITGIKINWECTISNDYPQAVQTRLAAGVALPDMMTVHDPVPYLNQGVFINLDNLINDYAPDIKKVFDDNKDVKASMSNPDGIIVCIPTIPKDINLIHTKITVIREDWLDRLGLKMPTTMDDWYIVLKAFKTGPGMPSNVIPFHLPRRTNLTDARAFSAAYGLELPYASGYNVNANGRVFYDYQTENAKEFITFMNRLATEGLVTFSNDPEGMTNLANGIAGSYDGWTNTIVSYRQMLVRNEPNAKLVPAPFPTTRFNSKPTTISPYSCYEYGASMFITKDCRQPEIAMKWLNFLFTPAGMNLTNFGVEGVHFDLVNGKAVINDFYLKNPNGMAPAEVQRHIGCRPSIPFYMSRDYEEQIKMLDPLTADAIPLTFVASRPPTFPSVMPSPQEVSSLRSIQADFDTFVSEQISKFILGERPIGEYDRFITELDSRGLQDILRVKQAQYDRYRVMTR